MAELTFTPQDIVRGGACGVTSYIDDFNRRAKLRGDDRINNTTPLTGQRVIDVMGLETFIRAIGYLDGNGERSAIRLSDGWKHMEAELDKLGRPESISEAIGLIMGTQPQKGAKAEVKERLKVLKYLVDSLEIDETQAGKPEYKALAHVIASAVNGLYWGQMQGNGMALQNAHTTLMRLGSGSAKIGMARRVVRLIDGTTDEIIPLGVRLKDKESRQNFLYNIVGGWEAEEAL